jgi:hypothetical protein
MIVSLSGAIAMLSLAERARVVSSMDRITGMTRVAVDRGVSLDVAPGNRATPMAGESVAPGGTAHADPADLGQRTAMVRQSPVSALSGTSGAPAAATDNPHSPTTHADVATSKQAIAAMVSSDRGSDSDRPISSASPTEAKETTDQAAGTAAEVSGTEPGAKTATEVWAAVQPTSPIVPLAPEPEALSYGDEPVRGAGRESAFTARDTVSSDPDPAITPSEARQPLHQPAPSTTAHENLTARRYIETAEDRDGRRTEAQLREWFTVVEAGSPLHQELTDGLFAFLAEFGKTPSTLMRINDLDEILHASDEVETADSNDTLVDLLVAVAKSLPATKFRKLREQLAA